MEKNNMSLEMNWGAGNLIETDVWKGTKYKNNNLHGHAVWKPSIKSARMNWDEY